MIYASNNNDIKTGGRLGNQIMRVMSLIGLSTKYHTPFAIPTWPYAQYFENNIPQTNYLKITRIVKEPYFHYCQNLLYGFDLNNEIIDLRGFFQSPKYWTERLWFKKSYLEKLRSKYDFSHNPIAVSVRRGDFVNHKCYAQLPISYYDDGITKHFSDYEQRAIFFFSDDIEWCRNNFHFPNALFIDSTDIEQLAVMSLCCDFVISNSTFSYVGSYLANCGKVIRPEKNFDGDYAVKNSEQDYWPPEWTPFNPLKQ